jgi:hypothetical protein
MQSWASLPKVYLVSPPSRPHLLSPPRPQNASTRAVLTPSFTHNTKYLEMAATALAQQLQLEAVLEKI